jgi:hypothetical protein
MADDMRGLEKLKLIHHSPKTRKYHLHLFDNECIGIGWFCVNQAFRLISKTTRDNKLLLNPSWTDLHSLIRRFNHLFYILQFSRKLLRFLDASLEKSINSIVFVKGHIP